MKGFNQQLYMKNLIKPSQAGLLWLRSEFSSLAIPEMYQLTRSYQMDVGEVIRWAVMCTPSHQHRNPLQIYFI